MGKLTTIKLTDEFIIKNADKFTTKAWGHISRNPSFLLLDLKTIRDFQDEFDWNSFFCSQKPTKEIYNEFEKNIKWGNLFYSYSTAKAFLKNCSECIDLQRIHKEQPNWIIENIKLVMQHESIFIPQFSASIAV